MREKGFFLILVILLLSGSAFAQDALTVTGQVTEKGIGQPIIGATVVIKGLMVSTNGMPGSEPEVKIRGIGTTNNSSPLYVVDGMFVNDIGFLNSHDIASMEVLKDASTTAIYGSRGANGVIIVTTKQGGKGRPVLTITGSEGFQVVGDRLKMANAEQYAQLLNEALENSGGEAKYPHPELLGKGTNWFDEIFRMASVRDYQVGLNGGSENISYNLSVGFFQQKGVIKRNDYHRLTVRLNNEYRPWERVTVGHNISAAFSLKSNDDASVVGQAYRLSPVIKPYNDEGDFSDSENSSTGNPLATLNYLNNNTRDDRVAGSAYLTWEIIQGLSFRTSFGIDYLNRRKRIFRPKFYVSPTQKNEQNELSKNWSPNHGWDMNHPLHGHNEAQITYLLAAASSTFPVRDSVYHKGWASDPIVRNGDSFYGITLPLGMDYGGPLFFTHYSYLGLDPRGVKDKYADYWQQNVNHTLINRQHAIVNPNGYKGYGPKSWGFTAIDGNGGYSVHDPLIDRGVITPTAALSSFPYTPEYSMEVLKHLYYDLGDKLWGEYGFKDAFNPTAGWVADSYLAIDQGPIIGMIENYRSGLLWKLFMSHPDVQQGLRKLGFESPALKNDFE